MIVEYLRELSPESQTMLDTDRPHVRNKRDASHIKYDDADEADTDIDLDDLRKVEIGSRDFSVRPKEYIGKLSECSAFRRQVMQLDQYELDKTLTQSDEQQLNIRKVLNYRYDAEYRCMHSKNRSELFKIGLG